MRPKQLKAKDLRAFAVVPIRALKDARITPKTLRVLVAFCSYADHMGRTFVSMERVGQDIGSSRTAVSNHVSKLKKLGYIVYAKPLWRGQRSISRRIVFDPHVKLEETIRSRLSPKQQMQLAEAETMAKMEHKLNWRVTNSQSDKELSELREEFECLTRDFFTAALSKGWRIKPEAIDRAKIMLATQAVELLSEPYSDEEAA